MQIAYKYKLKNGEGGTYISNAPNVREAWNELKKKYFNELASVMNPVNGQKSVSEYSEK